MRQALNLYDALGLEATLAYYNTKESVDGQWYVFIGDQDDMIIAHAANPDLVGRPASAAIGPNGYPAGEAVVAVADEDGAWFDYTFPNPASGAAGNQALLDGVARRGSSSVRGGTSAAPASPTHPHTPSPSYSRP